ncbi:MAG TPA: RecQ family ATP-dependent DNA helicase [Segeticoccus sp.]|uniref:RecQ family ATP-dependent DNA helicase n=1 Tax=Segeticoccus sp. TaxID=2706531 RepID=UPI002D7FC7C6|nr:RecQ family ATP-dependent DNA helicase [Segeticoccus sp.]HET8600961.1 RecQ family ATP-dependent DNA helicase [Segeticoccus sp.]
MARTAPSSSSSSADTGSGDGTGRNGTSPGDEVREALRRTARDSFGWDELRDGQLEAMSALMSGQDVLAVMPSGYGKSALYQVPALLLDGPTLVLSPLIALQRDQIAGIDRRAAGADDDGSVAPEAVAVNSSESSGDVADAWEAVRRDDAEFVFLAPEQLAKEEVLDRLARLDVSLVVVDEAHCVSAWGHDFRPDYLRIGTALDLLGRPRVATLTATAAPPVRDEIVERLGLQDPRVLIHGFRRSNIRLEVTRELEDHAKREAVLDAVTELTPPGLLYVATRKDTGRYAEQLADRGIRTAAYHGGLTADERACVHEQFTEGDTDVVVATSAFGMGIDKPDVHFVLHASAPASLDSYYQEIGRSGRDGDPACARLFYRPEDLSLQRFLTAHHADEEALRATFAHVRSAEGPVRITRLRREVDASARKVTAAVNLLEQVGALRPTRKGYTAAEHSLDDAVAAALELSEAHERVERSRVEMMRGYAETTECRWQFLLGYFGEQLQQPCGNCDNCDRSDEGHVETRPSARRRDADTPFPVESRVVHREWGAGTVMSVETDRLTVLFDDEGYRTLSLPMVEDTDLLEPEA